MNGTNTKALEKRRGTVPQGGGNVHQILGFAEGVGKQGGCRAWKRRESAGMSWFEWRTRPRSIRNALRGAVWLVRTQANARIHLLATGGVLAAAWLLEVRAGDWLWLVWSLVVVWMAEAFNTALEFLADEVSEERRERIGKAKDLAAFAVLVAAAGAAVTGVVVLGRRWLE